ncbi:PREDICTED: uncharacterized protein LOC101313175 [Fragaria vesca subsp. vesca]|uniref:uncharacterized protein LOC101313175 n=1 Tax=Fragaria vesca subsp. vesca TaxID=101020 RepID=UPI0002C3277F|nr:PREDICTED: uncharacterized protein LOC101313175 [Fragaria vesca subsp. vesca]
MNSKSNMGVLLIFVLFAASYGHGSEESSWGKKYFVRIVNNLDGNQELTFKCFSEDDIIGPRTIPPNEQFEFEFRETLFTFFQRSAWYSNYTCDFQAFNQKAVDAHCGGVHCIWTARQDGMYLFNIQTQEYVKKSDWSMRL